MVDYSRWDNIDTGTESSGDVPAPGPGPRPPGAVRAMDPASIMASLPDEVLALILANVDHASCHLTRATCGRFRDLNERASVVRVRALSFPQNWKVAKVQRHRTGADSRTTTTSTQTTPGLKCGWCLNRTCIGTFLVHPRVTSGLACI